MMVREPVVAGMFYPGEKEELERKVATLLGQSQKLKTKGQLAVLIVPHAGYQYSGSVAAAGFKQLEGGDFRQVILLGASHSAWFPGIAVFDRGSWATPLGQVEIDEKLAKRLIDPDFQVVDDCQAHRNEHSLEVQLPFLQTVLRNFKIAPLLIGQAQEESLARLAERASQTLRVRRGGSLLVVSSDLCHYPDYQTAKIVDQKTVAAILTGDKPKFIRTLDQLRREFPQVDTFACGAAAIKVGLLVADKLKAKGKVLDQKNSGDVGGEKARVVGYASIGFYRI